MTTHSVVERLVPVPGRQFKSVLILLLIGAAGLTLILSDRKDAVVIGLIVSFNAAIGVVREQRAKQAARAGQRVNSRLGLVGMLEPPRPHLRHAIDYRQSAS